MAQRIVALEMSADTVRAATAERSWNSFHLGGVFEKARASDEADLSGALTRVMAAVGEADIVISALPADRVVKRLLELPFKDVRRLHQVVPFALEEHLPFPVDNGLVAFTRVGRDGENSLVMAAMVRKQDLQHHLDLLAKAGIDPKTVTLAPLALASLFSRARNGSGPIAHLVVEGDESSTSVVLVDPAGIPRAMRSVSGGLIASDGTVATQDDATPILNSVRQTLLAHGNEIDQTDVVVAGPSATVPQVRALLSDSLALAVHDGGDFDYSALFDGARPNTGRFASCVAMLLGEMPTKPFDLINFRQNEFLFRGRIRGDMSPFYRSGLLAAAVLLAILIHFGFGVSTNLHRLNQVNSEIAEAAAPVLGSDVDPAEAKARLKAGIMQMKKRLHLMGGTMSNHAPLDTLMAVSRALPPRFPVEIADLQIDSDALRMTGQADSFTTVDQAKKALDQSGYFGAIEVTHAKAGSDPSKVDFRMDATFKDSGAGAE
jgi:hypothetical protein